MYFTQLSLSGGFASVISKAMLLLHTIMKNQVTFNIHPSHHFVSSFFFSPFLVCGLRVNP